MRARGNSDRPFTVVDDLERAAEVQYRATEKELVRKLQDAENSLDDLLKRGGGDAAQIEAVLSDEQKRQIEQTRVEMLELRRELRDVQGALRKDIDKLDALGERVWKSTYETKEQIWLRVELADWGALAKEFHSRRNT